jgi:uncharacterized protein
MNDGILTASPSAGPVLGAERVGAMDTLRGVAVLGILLMNILAFAYPFAASFDPTVAGGVTGANLWIWAVNTALFEGKMRAIFSMLFGAGMLVLTSRLEQRGLGVDTADIYYRRLLWLLAFGLIHAYFIWWGDILFFYSVLGLFLFPLRRLSARALIAAGVVLLLIGAGRNVVGGIDLNTEKAAAHAADVAAAAGQPLRDDQKAAQKTWADRLKEAHPKPDDLKRETDAYRGSYASAFQERAGFLVTGHPAWLYTIFIYDIGGMMLVGIGLMKFGFFTARLSFRTYALVALFGYGIGLPLASWSVSRDVSSGFELATVALGSGLLEIARLPIALGHVAVVMIVCKAGVLRWITAPLAAVGQTAFSGYILTSLICTTIFYGYGFGQFGYLQRYQLYVIVLAVWLFLLVASPLWLTRFRFGPLEWAWRSLTYVQRQPMRIVRSAAGPVAAV